jgi:eukaryotic-like serine/threonine-protein kinase
LGVIAEGGQGLIARARDRQTGQLVAVKMLTSATAQNSEFVERLAREQEAMLALAGTSAVAVLDLCRAPGGAPCLVMELLEGHDLERELGQLESAGQRLSLPRMFEIFDAIVETLERAHEVGILHRDIKPANIFLLSPEAGGGVRLLDFGLSRKRTAKGITVLGTILGSPSYIAPEVWRGRTDDLDQRVDVYSLSVVLFRVLAGRLPFEGESVQDKFRQATGAERPSLTALRPDLPRDVDAWVQQALAIDPAQRFSTVRAAWTALLRALRYAPSEAARLRPRVPASLVNAWRAARGAFRRAINGLPTPLPARPGSSRPPAASASQPGSSPSATPPTPAVSTSRRPPPPPPRRPSSRAPGRSLPPPVRTNAELLLDSDVLSLDDAGSSEQRSSPSDALRAQLAATRHRRKRGARASADAQRRKHLQRKRRARQRRRK